MNGESTNDADPVGAISWRSPAKCRTRQLGNSWISLGSLAIAEVKKNGVFVVPGLGRLVRVDRKARMGRNPATGEAIKIPAKKVVKFRVAKAAKDSIVPPKKK